MPKLLNTTRANTTVVCTAIHTIALNLSGIVWADAKKWDMPQAKELVAFPTLVTMRPTFLTYMSGGKPVGKEMPRGPDHLVEEAWQCDVYGVYFFDPSDDRTYETANDTMDALRNTFVQYVDLNPTGFITGLTITNPGSDYTDTPTVSFSGGGGSLAAATATVAGGSVTKLKITNPGVGYTSAPALAFSTGAATAQVDAAVFTGLREAPCEECTIINPNTQPLEFRGPGDKFWVAKLTIAFGLVLPYQI